MGRKIGFDLVETVRFAEHAGDRNGAFLKKVFFGSELDYCFGHADPAPHLAGIFAAKEAASKALGVERHPFAEIEIRREKNGRPAAFKKGKKLRIAISITHTGKIAGAIALA